MNSIFNGDNKIIVVFLNLHMNPCWSRATCWMWNAKRVTCALHVTFAQSNASHVLLATFRCGRVHVERFIHKSDSYTRHAYHCFVSIGCIYIFQTRVCLVFCSNPADAIFFATFPVVFHSFGFPFWAKQAGRRSTAKCWISHNKMLSTFISLSLSRSFSMRFSLFHYIIVMSSNSDVCLCNTL